MLARILCLVLLPLTAAAAPPALRPPADLLAFIHRRNDPVCFDGRHERPLTERDARFSELRPRPHVLISLAAGEGCECGNDNCWIEAWVRSGSTFRVVLSGIYNAYRFGPNGSVTIWVHASAYEEGRDTYVWDGTRYATRGSVTVKFGTPAYDDEFVRAWRTSRF